MAKQHGKLDLAKTSNIRSYLSVVRSSAFLVLKIKSKSFTLLATNGCKVYSLVIDNKKEEVFPSNLLLLIGMIYITLSQLVESCSKSNIVITKKYDQSCTMTNSDSR
jgi:hypothetical protein